MNWIETQDGSYTCKHPDHLQTYHSTQGAWSECQQVFLNPVKEHAQKNKFDHWSVLDVGFGLGLNWLSFVDYALKERVNLTIHSLENNPELLKLEMHPQAQSLVSREALNFLDSLKTNAKISHAPIEAELHIENAIVTLQKWLMNPVAKFNVILQDAFSAQVNPELWSEDYFKILAQLCLPQTLLVTYAAASAVQKALKNAGFEVYKQKGFGTKRERLVAIFKSDL